mmetsp:Transcript_19086/g.44179  ORF Transcript_19086/g.44179 Transcript_19086/m.44179 type:complete len:356 (-) Transcript_19086:2963-4030(-)
MVLLLRMRTVSSGTWWNPFLTRRWKPPLQMLLLRHLTALPAPKPCPRPFLDCCNPPCGEPIPRRPSGPALAKISVAIAIATMPMSIPMPMPMSMPIVSPSTIATMTSPLQKPGIGKNSELLVPMRMGMASSGTWWNPFLTRRWKPPLQMLLLRRLLPAAKSFRDCWNPPCDEPTPRRPPGQALAPRLHHCPLSTRGQQKIQWRVIRWHSPHPHQRQHPTNPGSSRPLRTRTTRRSTTWPWPTPSGPRSSSPASIRSSTRHAATETTRSSWQNSCLVAVAMVMGHRNHYHKNKNNHKQHCGPSWSAWTSRNWPASGRPRPSAGFCRRRFPCSWATIPPCHRHRHRHRCIQRDMPSS